MLRGRRETPSDWGAEGKQTRSSRRKRPARSAAMKAQGHNKQREAGSGREANSCPLAGRRASSVLQWQRQRMKGRGRAHGARRVAISGKGCGAWVGDGHEGATRGGRENTWAQGGRRAVLCCVSYRNASAGKNRSFRGAVGIKTWGGSRRGPRAAAFGTRGIHGAVERLRCSAAVCGCLGDLSLGQMGEFSLGQTSVKSFCEQQRCQVQRVGETSAANALRPA